MKICYITTWLALLSFVVNVAHSQSTSANSCSRVYRSTRRSGMLVAGQLTIPVDSNFPQFKLEVKLSRAVHSVTIRQMKARDTGAHREFVIDSMAPVKNGVITLNSLIRLRSLFGTLPRVTQVVHNGKLLCGAGTDSHGIGDAVIVDLFQRSTTSTTESDAVFYRDGLDDEDRSEFEDEMT